ncbi:MAG: hypothetical protein C0617_12980 [Desulfuromonas sp.]|uniref:S8 family serine peptidase n=1 Tax=Desulfuromonas sp. TaxID=892 RepID=UPI000CB0B364|nr:S8 family serine peptidase [Desulfuromonas sp.]PLX83000.1 MAG: hypothetical protein C0617_12980 [Desulfuromonas sp.]
MYLLQWRTVLLLTLGVFALLSGPERPAFGAVLDPGLRAVLDGAAAGEKVPVIVTFAGRADLEGLKGLSRGERRTGVVKRLRAGAEQVQGPCRAFLRTRGVERLQPLWIINGLAVSAPAEVIRSLAERPEVAGVALDATLRRPATPAPAAHGVEGNISIVGAEQLWALGYTGNGVVVAGMDTGVDPDHPDLAERWRGGDNSWFNPFAADCSPSGFDCTACEASADRPCDGDGNGTQTMGIVLGGDAGGAAIGVAPGARWIAVKIFDDYNLASISAIHRGFQWLLDPDGDPDTDDAPDVVNNSWGFEDFPGVCFDDFDEDLRALRSAGILQVFAAGNMGPDPETSISPANDPNVLSVGSVGNDLEVTFSSSRGPSACDGAVFPDLVAPGEFVKTADITLGGLFTDSYVFVDGTSFAAPHVAGVAALLLEAFPETPVALLETVLRQGASDLGVQGPDNDAGFGLVNAPASLDALQAELGNRPPDPVVLLDPPDGALGLDTTVTFRWNLPSDPDGDALTTTLLISKFSDFSDSESLVVAAFAPIAGGALLAGAGGLLLWVVPCRGRRRGRTALLVLVAGAALFLLSCGGGGGSSEPVGKATVSGLDPATTYFWKVTVDDGREGVAESEVRSFSTR